uniref:Uncharacterized protein n=1 Tax=Anguilla anguilla TaxID=7936 RepID=A0A0E9T2S5_ANGAN
MSTCNCSCGFYYQLRYCHCTLEHIFCFTKISSQVICVSWFG